MISWREQLRGLAQAKDPKASASDIYDLRPPAGTEMDRSLPASDAIRDFYSLCDGGVIDDYRFSSLAELKGENDHWFALFHDYHGDGTNPLIRGRHLILATDGAGAPLIWDAESDRMATFWFKGGDWEPLSLTFEELMTELLFPADTTDP